MKIALTQFKADDDVNKNLEKQFELIEKASKGGAKVVCTQELFMSKYFCIELDEKNFELAQKFNDELIAKYSKLASDLDIVIIASLYEDAGNGVYFNTSIVIDADGKYLGKYRKMHIPHDPCFEEKYYFTQGDLGYKCFKTKYGKIGVLICWDQWYPEAARLTALEGADIIFYPTAIGGLLSESQTEVDSFYNAWQTVQRGHGVANGIYIAAANRVGVEENSRAQAIKFWGKSFVSNPYGEFIAVASDDEEEVLIADVDLSLVEDFRKTWPFFRDRRIDSYKDIQLRVKDNE